ncbi:hypothetical protein ABH931_007500 [Streptacidiphilus sp. MAP12-33]|uniref:hypothetical protein n=1 Tax=Streptacidiphilus sp. MAP12-33 TaxID=3156266 RepID=UPI0035139D30
MRARSALAAGATAAAAAAAGYPWLWRHACLTWGASAVEVGRAMPGDDLLPAAPLVSTRAVTVRAWPSTVWPWLVHLGPGRGGAYTYDWIEGLVGLDRHRTLPRPGARGHATAGGGPWHGERARHAAGTGATPPYREPKPGDLLPLGRRGPALEVTEVEPDQCLVLRSQDGQWVWSFALYPRGHSTRLVSRNRIEEPGSSPASRLLSLYLLEPVGLVMERKMLLGVKRGAEELG